MQYYDCSTAECYASRIERSLVWDWREALLCVFEQDTLPSGATTFSTQDDRNLSQHDCKIVGWDVKKQWQRTMDSTYSSDNNNVF